MSRRFAGLRKALAPSFGGSELHEDRTPFARTDVVDLVDPAAEPEGVARLQLVRFGPPVHRRGGDPATRNCDEDVVRMPMPTHAPARRKSLHEHADAFVLLR